MDPDPSFEKDAAQTERQTRRLQRGVVRLEQPRAEHRRVAPFAHRAGVELDEPAVGDAEPRRLRDQLGPGAVLRRRGRRGEMSRPREPRVDVVVAHRTPRSHRRCAARSRRSAPRRRRRRTERAPGGPPTCRNRSRRCARSDRAPQISSPSSSTTSHRGIAFREEPGGPHSGVAAAEDHDVGGGRAGERRDRAPARTAARASSIHQETCACRGSGSVTDRGCSRDAAGACATKSTNGFGS